MEKLNLTFAIQDFYCTRPCPLLLPILTQKIPPFLKTPVKCPSFSWGFSWAFLLKIIPSIIIQNISKISKAAGFCHICGFYLYLEIGPFIVVCSVTRDTLLLSKTESFFTFIFPHCNGVNTTLCIQQVTKKILEEKNNISSSLGLLMFNVVKEHDCIS